MLVTPLLNVPLVWRFALCTSTCNLARQLRILWTDFREIFWVNSITGEFLSGHFVPLNVRTLKLIDVEQYIANALDSVTKPNNN